MGAKRTYCRLCEVGCGLIVHTDENGRVDKVRPDHDHPATKGFACSKGLLTAEIHRDAARLRRPQRRGDAGFGDVDWTEATSEIGSRLRELVDEHGPRAVGIYLGNPLAFNCLAGAGCIQFARTIGTDRMFSSVTQDCSNKYATAELLYGVTQAHPIPDLEHTELLLVVGSNPRVSKSSFLSVADPVRALREIRDRGGRVVFVNPLEIEPGIGDTLQIRPDSDPYLLAAMLHEIHRSRGFELGAFAGAVRGVEVVEDFVGRFSPEVVSPVVGVPAEEIVTLAHEFADASGASIHVSTGLNMGRQGALGYWLAQMLLILTGNLDRAGGNYFAARGLPPPAAPVDRSEGSFVETKWGRYRPTVGMMPSALLAEVVEDPDEPLRALVVVAGNPALSVGGGDRLQEALGSLELLVSIDLYRNATGELADYVLPATDQFEREDLNTFVQGVQAKPFVQWTDRIVTPDSEQREEWRILSELLQAMGHSVFLDPTWEDPLPLVYDAALAGQGLSIAGLRERAGVALLDEAGPGDSIRRLRGDDPIECVPEAFGETLRRAHDIFAELVVEPEGRFKLITRRTAQMLNSAMQNIEVLKHRGADTNPLWMNPQDGRRLGLDAGCVAEVSNTHGVLTAEVRFDPALREGVVAMTHGFGNASTDGMPVAQRHPGVNVNILGPSGPGTFDPVSGMAQLTGIGVEIARSGGGTASR